MTEIRIFSDDEGLCDLFRGINRSKYYRTAFRSWDEWSGDRTEHEAGLIYLDITGRDMRWLRERIREITADGAAWAVIDPQGIVEDPAELFHMGACDYLPPSQLTDRIKTARLHRVIDFHRAESPGDHPAESENLRQAAASRQDTSASPKRAEWLIPSGTDWSFIQQGREYSFYFLYIALLPGEEWSVKTGETNRQHIQSQFEQAIRKWVTPDYGKIWMWNGWGGVVLFPFSPAYSQPVITATRLIFNRPLISIEDMKVDSLVDYHLALHVGNTVYNPRGDTGELISDDINFIFHLGKKRMEKNSFYVTETAYPQVPQRMRRLFADEEPFEGRSLHRMHRILFRPS
jgi:hypothetical protein